MDLFEMCIFFFSHLSFALQFSHTQIIQHYVEHAAIE